MAWIRISDGPDAPGRSAPPEGDLVVNSHPPLKEDYLRARRGARVVPSVLGVVIGLLVLCAVGALFFSLVGVAIIKLWGWAL